MEKTDLRESKKEIPVYRVSSIATRPFFLSNKSNINQYTVATRHRRSETLETTTAIYNMLQKQNRHQTMQNAMHSMWKGEMATPLCRRSEHHTKMQHLPRNMAA